MEQNKRKQANIIGTMTSRMEETADSGATGAFGKTWEVHKFGGTSVASAECYLKVAAIVEEQLGFGDDDDGTAPTKCLAVVVSAMGGKPKVTDLLLSSVRAAAVRDEEGVDSLLDQILTKHAAALAELDLDAGVSERLKGRIVSDLSDIRDILKTVSLMKWQAARISELVSGYGELWSAQILSALLEARSKSRRASDPRCKQHRFAYLDARRVITIDEEAIDNGAVVWQVSDSKLRDVYEAEQSHEAEQSYEAERILHFVVTGYVASNTEGVATTLQRDGSDYSAAIMGRLLQAQNISIWTDVDGILSADPRRVPHAHVISEVSYNEAMELAYFGAKVIHPKCVLPAIISEPQIPIYIRNTFNSSFPGSRIYTSSTSTSTSARSVCDKSVSGFSSIERIALINVEGMVGNQGFARRLFTTLERFSLIFISQASSEHSITFACAATQADDAKHAIEEEFQRELRQKHISSIDIKAPCSIIAAVGDGMSQTAGVSGRFFAALGEARINILAISQGCSERNISAVVWQKDSTRALRGVHAAFRLSHTTVYVGLVGMNDVGDSLLKLLESQRSRLRDEFEIDLQVRAVADSAQDLITLKNLDDKYTDSITIQAYNAATGGALLLGAPASSSVASDSSHTKETLTAVQFGGIAAISDYVKSDDIPHSIIFDCTADESVGIKHAEWLGAGIHVISANNFPLSGSKEIRQAIRSAETAYGKQSAQYLREVTVGGGLPIISTLRDLLNSGDSIRRVDGILSVSWSYIMHRIAPPSGASNIVAFDEESTCGAYSPRHSMSPKSHGDPCSFSAAVKEAIGLGLMEEDPMKDLSYEYTARCLMVLAIELGVDKDLDVERILDANQSAAERNRTFEEIAPSLDALMADRVAQAAAQGCVPRHVSSIDVKSGDIEIKIANVPSSHIFATTPPSNECVRFFTARHRRFPLIVQGPSAGVDSTASALLAELLHLMRRKVGPRSKSVI